MGTRFCSSELRWKAIRVCDACRSTMCKRGASQRAAFLCRICDKATCAHAWDASHELCGTCAAQSESLKALKV